MTLAAGATGVAVLARPYVETHPIRWVWLVVGGATALIEVIGIFRQRSEATRGDRGSLVVMRAVTIPAVVFVILSPRFASWADIHPPLASVVAGLVIFAAGEGLRIWSKLTLGRYFTYTVQTSSDQPVITGGPYRFVRHPSYTGLLLIEIGFGLVWANWLGLVVLTAAAVAALSYRIHVEEAALAADLGDRYVSYAREHKRLIPFLW